MNGFDLLILLVVVSIAGFTALLYHYLWLLQTQIDNWGKAHDELRDDMILLSAELGRLSDIADYVYAQQRHPSSRGRDL